MVLCKSQNSETQKPTWYVYDQFSFDPLAEFRFPNKEVHLRRVQTVGSPISKLYSREIFSGQTPNDPLEGEDPTQLGRYAYFYTDHRYDTSSILKHSGQSLHSYLYDEYGMMYDNNKKPRDASNFTQFHNYYTFSQKEFDPESQLSYFGARSYDVFSGTWTTQDIVRGAITDPASLHRYAYVANNPINYIDEYGFESKGINPFVGLLVSIGTSALQNESFELFSLDQFASDQTSTGSTVRSNFSGTASLDFSGPSTAVTGKFNVSQQTTSTNSQTIQFARGEGGTELLGPSRGAQLAGATVTDNTVEQIINVRKVNGQGDRYLTPQSKFALDEEKALIEAQQRAKDLKIKERNQRIAQIQQQFEEWYYKGYWYRNVEEGFRERDAILKQARQYNALLDKEKFNQAVREQETIGRINSFLKPYTVELSGNLLKDLATQSAASGRLASDVLNKKADKAWKAGQWGDSLILSSIAGVFESSSKLVNPESTKNERELAFVLLAIDVGTSGRGSAAKQGIKKSVEKICVTYCDEAVEFSYHALQRMAERKISREAVQETIENGIEFTYKQKGQILKGFYNKTTKLFVGIGERVTTVMDDVTENYIRNVINRK